MKLDRRVTDNSIANIITNQSMNKTKFVKVLGEGASIIRYVLITNTSTAPLPTRAARRM
jgi:hypothetical protein